MGAGWDRLESMVRGVDLTEGLQARIPDPLGMIARQWQLGEFTGDDAAQPAAVRVVSRTARLASYRAGSGAPVTFPTDRPLEMVVEDAPPPALGSAGLYAAARASRRLVRMLRTRGLGAAVSALRKAYPLPAAKKPIDVGESGRVAGDLLSRCALDVVRLAAAPPSDIEAALAGLAPDDRARATSTVDTWRQEHTAGAPATEPAWDDHRLEHSFSLAAHVDSGELILHAPEHDGGHLDWHTVDVGAGTHGLTAAELPRRTTVGVPTPARYPGMPASRWWEFEDSAVHFGDLGAGPADLARLVVAEFAIAYSDDHFVLPIPVAVGSLTEVELVEVIDTFGGRTRVPSAAKADFDRIGSARVWRMFELTGDEVSDAHPAPWLFVPPSAPALSGPPLERVTLTRDEAANLAWGIEQLIEGPLGRCVRRANTWTAPDAAATAPVPAAAADGSDAWRYRLGGTAPPWWIPFVAERIGTNSAQVRLRRARLAAWGTLAGQPVGPRSILLDPGRPVWLFEEEVPVGGVRVERSWQLARWHDGSVHLWLQRRKRPGRGDPNSGVRWDLID